jgi:hypothetical protein
MNRPFRFLPLLLCLLALALVNILLPGSRYTLSALLILLGSFCLYRALKRSGKTE